MVCERCGYELQSFNPTCPRCAALAAMQRCAGCGWLAGGGDRFCARCGGPLGQAAVVPPPPPGYIALPPGKSRWTAAAWAFLLGFAGAHHFYRNRAGWGLAYLLAGGLTCGLGWLLTWPVAWIEALVYLVHDDESFAARNP